MSQEPRTPGPRSPTLAPTSPRGLQSPSGTRQSRSGSIQTPSVIPFSSSAVIPDLGTNIRNYSHYEVPWCSGITVGAWLEGLKAYEPAEQKTMVDEWMTALVLYFDQTSKVVIATGEFIKTQSSIMAQYGGINAFLARYPLLKDVKSYREKREAAAQSAYRWLKDNVPDVIQGVIVPYSSPVIYNHTALGDLRWALDRFEITELAPFLNAAFYHRRQSTRRRQDNYVNATDWGFVRDILNRLPENVMAEYRENRDGEIYTAHKAARMSKDIERLRRDMRTRKSEVKSEHTFWTIALQWYSRQEHRGKKTPLAITNISQTWRKEHGLTIHAKTKLLIPHTPVSDEEESRLQSLPWTDEVRQRKHMIAAAEEQGSQSPARPSNLSGRSVVIGADGVARRANDTSILSKQLPNLEKEMHEHSQAAVSRSLSQMTLDPDGEDGSIVEDRRIEGNVQTAQASDIIDGLAAMLSNRNRAHSAPLAPPSIQDRQSPAVTQLRNQSPALLTALDEDVEILDSIEVDHGFDTAQAASTGKGCGCTNKNSTLCAMLKKIDEKKKLTDPQRKKLIDTWYREVVNNNPSRDSNGLPRPNHTRVCWYHLKYIASKMGLKTRNLNVDKTVKILKVLYYCQDQWGRLQADPVTHTLFISEFQGIRTNDDLLSYRYRPVAVSINIDWDRVAKAMGFEATIENFKKHGSIVMNTFVNCYRSSDFPNFEEIIDECFDMYRYHTREIDGKSNLGWCRTMYHSIIQQFIRGDVGYWLLYAILRRETNLISYPYYTKYTMPKDNTYFRHIDLNISNAAHSGKGVDLIQGSVSFDDEDDSNCTEILRGFHGRFNEYQAWRTQKGIADSTGYIEGWNDAIDYPEELREKWPNVEWRKQPCSRGQVRISDPRLPHGSTGPATKVRRTILPWFVKVGEDMQTMEIPEMGTYAEIQAAYQSLCAAPKTPSGHPNKYGGVRWPFPGDVTPIYTSPISMAINCQARWDSPLVLNELRDLLTGDISRDKITNYIHTTRVENWKMLTRHWEICKQAERRAFGPDTAAGIPDRSFFSNHGKQPQRGQEWHKYDGQIEQRTALSRLWEELSDDPTSRIINRRARSSSSVSVGPSRPTHQRQPSKLSQVSSAGSESGRPRADSNVSVTSPTPAPRPQLGLQPTGERHSARQRGLPPSEAEEPAFIGKGKGKSKK